MNDINSLGSPLSKYKLVFLGDQSVGKTAVINRFIFDTFEGREHPTVGIDFVSKVLNFENRTIRLQLWDTAGQERFRSLIPSYIRDCSVALIVFDITVQNSFVNIKRWIEDVKNERGADVIMVIIGNKTDLEDQRAVSTQEAEQFAKENDAMFFECSAKTGQNVTNIFMSLASVLPGSEMSQILSPPSGPGGKSGNEDNKGTTLVPESQTNEVKKKKGCAC